MNMLNTLNVQQETPQISHQVAGRPLNIGEGFEALSFKHDQFKGLMDPLVMIDHYTMSRPTFGAHPHAGMSALSILFEDSTGIFNNRDSLGNNIDLQPGDAYWLKAGSGAVHDEKPTKGSRTHGLQIFVNLPKQYKHDDPAALHVPANAMPIISGEGYRVRVVLGESNGTQGAESPALPLTALDAFLENQGVYAHNVDRDQTLVIYTVTGDLKVKLGSNEINLSEQKAIAIRVGATSQQLNFTSAGNSHFVILQGAQVSEQFVQKGPFVMSSLAEIQQVTASYEAGLLGTIAD